jgi:hypothetical protein
MPRISDAKNIASRVGGRSASPSCLPCAAAESGNIWNAEFMTTSDIFGAIRYMISENTAEARRDALRLADDGVRDHVCRLVGVMIVGISS